MKRLFPWLIAAAGVVVVTLVLPLYQPGQPSGIRITRQQAQEAADRAARQVGIPSDSWSTLVWFRRGSSKKSCASIRAGTKRGTIRSSVPVSMLMTSPTTTR